MKFEVKTEGDLVVLQIGDYGASFAKDASLEQIIIGVNHLIERMTGAPVFELVAAVMNEMNGDTK